MPINMLLEFSTIKLLLKHHSADQLNTFKHDHKYNTRNTGLQPIRTNNKRGERSLLSSGIALYNRYLLGAEMDVWSGRRDGLSDRLWAFW